MSEATNKFIIMEMVKVVDNFRTREIIVREHIDENGNRHEKEIAELLRVIASMIENKTATIIGGSLVVNFDGDLLSNYVGIEQ